MSKTQLDELHCIHCLEDEEACDGLSVETVAQIKALVLDEARKFGIDIEEFVEAVEAL